MGASTKIWKGDVPTSPAVWTGEEDDVVEEMGDIGVEKGGKKGGREGVGVTADVEERVRRVSICISARRGR